MSHFDFKQFRIHHDRCAMKVGTDGVLLGAWAKIQDNEDVLDIGTGTGLIAIMLAQRANCQVTGIEVDTDAALQAQQNAQDSPFGQRITIDHTDLLKFYPQKTFDNVVSNPPFYKEDILPPGTSRATARHCQGLTFEILIKEAKRLLKPDGLFQVIIPHAETSRFIGLCALQEMSLLRQTDICTKKGKACKRSLLTFVNNIKATQPLRETLFLTSDDGKRSEAYQLLTKDFYLK